MIRVSSTSRLPSSVALALLAALGGSGCGFSGVEAHGPLRPYPSAAVLDVTLPQAKARAKAALTESGAPGQVFGRDSAPLDGYADYFSVEDASDVVFGQKVFDKPENRNDLYAHTFHEPLWPSPVYRRDDKPLPFIAAFHVHFESAGDDAHTSVRVNALDTEVISGKSWGMGSCGPGHQNDYERVAPTGIEESRMLIFLTRALERKEPHTEPG